QVCLGVRHQKIFRLSSVYCISESPTADGLIVASVPALGPLGGKTRATLAARGNSTHKHPVTLLIPGNARSHCLDDTNWFMSDHQAWFYRVLSANDMHVGPAYGGQGHADNGIAWTRDGPRNSFASIFWLWRSILLKLSPGSFRRPISPSRTAA